MDLLPYGQFSVHEIWWRTHLVEANLQQVGNFISRSAVYDSLDPSEKGAVSFFLGMAMPKLAAEFLLDTPWLVHLLKVQQVSLPGRSRPDLIGRSTTGSHIVVEAKGRTNDFDSGAMTTAKTQAQQVTSIFGSPPQYSVAIQAYFSEHLELALEDPRPSDVAVEIDGQAERLLEAYYEPFKRLSIERNRVETIDGQPYHFVDLDALDTSIGISEQAVENSLVAMDHLDDRVRAGFVRGQAVHLYRDGLAVELGPSWSGDRMSLPFEERHRV